MAQMPQQNSEPVLLHDPAMEQPACREDEKERGDDVGQKMPALRHADRADDGAQRDRAADGETPALWHGHEEAERDEIESGRRIAGREGAVARALIAWHEGGGEALVAAELTDLRWPRPAPMILKQRVDDEPRPHRQRDQ